MTRFLCVVLPLVLLTGCDQQSIFERFIPKEDAEFAKGYLSFFQSGDFAAIEKSLDPTLREPQLRSKLEQIANFFPKENPKSVRVVGSESNTTNNGTSVNLTFEYEYSTTWLLANVLLLRTGNVLVVRAVNVQPKKESLGYTNRFTFESKGLTHYVVLASAILVPLFILYVLVLAIRTPIPKRKWLWIVFILLGVMTLSLNWTTGDINVAPVSVQFLGAAFAKMGPVAPIVLSVSLPLGAVIFLLKRRKWMTQPQSVTNEG